MTVLTVISIIVTGIDILITLYAIIHRDDDMK